MKTRVLLSVAFDKVVQLPPAHVPLIVFWTKARPAWITIGDGLFGAAKFQFCTFDAPKEKLVGGSTTLRAVKSTMNRLPLVRTPASPALLVAAKVPATRSKLPLPLFAPMTSGGVLGPTR